jgi:hypothetical protein
MLSLPAAVRIHLCAALTDMRKSFDSLAALAESVVKEDARSGHLFVFRNRRGDRIKILVWGIRPANPVVDFGGHQRSGTSSLSRGCRACSMATPYPNSPPLDHRS